jgi:hypothetical protein
VHRETLDWEELTQNFKVTFKFEVESPLVDVALQVIINNFFMEEGQIEIVHMCSVHRETMIVHELLECYNVCCNLGKSRGLLPVVQYIRNHRFIYI